MCSRESSSSSHAMTSVGICTSVVSGAKILVCDRLLKVPDTTTLALAELFEKVKPDRERVVHEDVIKYSSKPGSSWIGTELENDVGVLVNDFGCKYIRFMVPMQDSVHPPSSKHVYTVNDVLMAVSRDRTKLPRKKILKNKEELFNDVQGFFEGRQVADSEGYEVVNYLTN